MTVPNYTIVLDEIISRLDVCIDLGQLRYKPGYRRAHDYLAKVVEEEKADSYHEGEIDGSGSAS